MGYFKSLPPDADIPPVFHFSPPQFVRHLIHLHEIVLRDEGALPIKLRELIAAYTSGILGAAYAYDAHRTVSIALGWPAETVDALIRDVESAPVEPKIKALLTYVQRLTVSPTTVRRYDYDQVSEAGWSDKELNLTVIICSLYNFMSRYTLGHGLRLHPENADREREHGEALAKFGYIGDLVHLGFKPIVEQDA